MTRIYIIDDEPAAIALLKRLLKENYQVELVGDDNDVTPETIERLVAADPDLLFLDVEMPSGKGLDFWPKVKPMLKPEIKVVFYTGWDKYMLDALRRQAFDYLLKPVTLPELQKIMTRYLEQRLEELTTRNNASNLPNSRVLVTNAMGVLQAKHFDEIAFFRYNTERKLWEVVTTDAQTALLRHRTTAEVILGYSTAFVQIHKRYIVNTQKITHIEDQLCLLEPPLQDCKELRISKNYRHTLLSTFYNL